MSCARWNLDRLGLNARISAIAWSFLPSAMSWSISLAGNLAVQRTFRTCRAIGVGGEAVGQLAAKIDTSGRDTGQGGLQFMDRGFLGDTLWRRL
jgi:hypothetical protein